MCSTVGFTMNDIEDYLIKASKKEDETLKLIIRGHRDSVIQWMEMFDKEVRDNIKTVGDDTGRDYTDTE